MRRAILSAALTVASTVAACGDSTLTEGLHEPIAVQGGQFVEGPIPGLPPDGALENPRPTAASTEVTSLRPRLAGVPFFGWATLDAVSVSAQIEGLGTGHWVLPTGPADPTVQGEPVRTWRFLADLHDALPPGRHRLLVAATDIDGKTGSQVASSLCIQRLVPDNGNVCDPQKVPPQFVISLAWDRPVDLDLLVVTPSGEIIGSRNPGKGIGPDDNVRRNAIDQSAPPGSGFLDMDSNHDCHIDGRQIEDVIFQDKAEPGSYLVYVNLHDACGERAVHYTVSRHARTALDPAAATYSVTEESRTSGTLTAIQATGDTSLGTFVAEFFIP